MDKLYLCPICYLKSDSVASACGICSNCSGVTTVMGFKYCQICAEKYEKCFDCGQDIQHGNYYSEKLMEETRDLLEKISKIQSSEINYKDQFLENDKPNINFYFYLTCQEKINNIEKMQTVLENLDKDNVLQLMKRKYLVIYS
jgi:hypothetical protein